MPSTLMDRHAQFQNNVNIRLAELEGQAGRDTSMDKVTEDLNDLALLTAELATAVEGPVPTLSSRR